MKKGEEFDCFASKYREIHNSNVRISGADSDYFARYKAVEVSRKETGFVQEKILDLGCGDGVTTGYLRYNFPEAKIFGVDVSMLSIKEAEKKSLKNCFFVVYDGENLPYNNNFFDFIFVSCVFHHVDGHMQRKLIGECYRILKPGGRIYFFEHNPWNPLTKKIVKECVFDKDAKLINSLVLRNLVKKAGFQKIKIKYTIFFPRQRTFKPFFSLEKLLSRIPLGGQYYIFAIKSLPDA